MQTGGNIVGFEDQLKKSTKTEATLIRERKLQQDKKIRYMAQVFVRAFSMACKGAASAGKHSIKWGIPVHLVNDLNVHGGYMNYANNESYIAHCYNYASQSNTIFYPFGFFSPCELQTFNIADKSACINGYYTYPRSYADSLVNAIKDELKKNDFTKAQIVYNTGNDVIERSFFKEKKVHKPFYQNGVTYYYIGIKTEW